MNSWLVELLRCPTCGAEIQLNGSSDSCESIDAGVLICRAQHRFHVRNGIPRFVLPSEANQDQTAESFGFKWQQLWGHEGETRAFYQEWFLRRFGFKTLDELSSYLASKSYVLDAGVGNGQSAKWYTRLMPGRWVGVDISRSVDVAQSEWARAANRDLVQADISRLPFRTQVFDLVISDGVLHHTPSTNGTLAAVANVLRPGGEVMFYVYRRKGPIREFTDDYVRAAVAPLPPDRAWQVLKPLTRFGASLARAGVTIDVPEDMPFLGVAAGRYDLQRFLYEHVVKMFWNEAFSFEENHHVNFDWFHPQYAHRHTVEEVAGWCQALDLEITHQAVEVSGITVRAVKH